VIAGQFCQLPERPDDLETLWATGAPLTVDNLPPWLTADIMSGYRRVTQVDLRSLSPENQQHARHELEYLGQRGLIVEPELGEATQYTVYLHELKRDQVWSLGLYEGPSPFTLQPAAGVRQPILSRRDVTDVPASFLGDPFVLRVESVTHLFCEVFNWQTGLGEIACASSHDERQWTYDRIVLREPFHLSYPQVFVADGNYYLIPESHQAQAVRLYEAVEFPHRWRFVANLLHGQAFMDPTILFHGGRWWLFVETDAAHRCDTLRLYSSPELHGPWQEHPRSPVIAGDSHSARPAGRILRYNDGLFRMAQDCHDIYGQAVRVQAITRLTETEYAEQELETSPILQAGPPGAWNAAGMHHVDAWQLPCGTWRAVVDGWEWGQIGY